MKTFTTLILMLFTLSAFAYENVKIEANDFRTNEAGFEEAWKHIETGDFWFEYGEMYFALARLQYLAAYKYNPQNAALNYKIGVCFIHSTQKSKALQYFRKAYQSKPNVAHDIHFLLGRAYHVQMKFETAIAEYELYKIELLAARKHKKAEDVQFFINQCFTGLELIDKPNDVKIENIGGQVNSNFPEYCPLLPADASFIVFTSRRQNTCGGGTDFADQGFFEDIYIAQKGENGWTKAQNDFPQINTCQHDATVGISPDGNSLLIYNDHKRGGDLFVCTQTATGWSAPKRLKGRVNTRHHEPSACLSTDGETLFFVSDRPGGQGGHDIYQAHLTPKGKWKNIQNLGQNINTPLDEDGVFLHPDGKTLFFSSKGHNSMGGYDIFKSVKKPNGLWSKPVNLGFPINTADDDIYFVMTADKKYAYYSSVKRNGLGDKDIYKITFENQQQQQTTLPVLAAIDETPEKEESMESILASETTASTTPESLTSPAPSPAKAKNKTAEKTTPKDQKQSFEIHSIYFDYNKHTLRKASRDELKNVLAVMKTNPNLKIVISGHTDSTGSLARNRVLSAQRAHQAGKFLIQSGIEKNRIEYKALNFSQPAATNATAKGRQLNRRVQFQLRNIQ